MTIEAYREFLAHKTCVAADDGFDVPQGAVSEHLKPHCQAIVPWLLAGGRRALFAAFGLGKTGVQLEAVRIASEHMRGRGLIVVPLGARAEFMRDATEILQWSEPPRFIRSIDEADATGVYLTNYETVRDGKIDPRAFDATSLDEASVLRGFGGTKTFREFMALFAGDDRTGGGRDGDGIPFRFVATATPSPNDYIELLAYAAFLGVMDVGEAKTRFFKRDSEHADKLTLHPHKEEEFWLWVASWALFVQKPSDLGFSDEGYELPELDIRWHEIPSNHAEAGSEKDGQARMFKSSAFGVQDAAQEKRSSLPARIDKCREIRSEAPDEHRLIWHDLEDERRGLEQAFPEVATVYGNQDLEEREGIVADFADGRVPELAAKPVMLGSGTNLQRHCAWAIYLGIGHKFNDFIQSLHRLHRFLQKRRVRVDLIYTEAEREVRDNLLRKWRQHERMVARMTEIIREYGLAQSALAQTLQRSMGVERVEASGRGYRCINHDCVEELHGWADHSVGLICTSIPFSTQYEYTPTYNDFGHTDDNDHFWQQMDFLIPQLLRVLEPGRICAVHVKDRIVPGGINGLGFQTVNPFSDETVAAFRKHGFGLIARKTITTDVVRENNQTYRLGWSEQCKDGSRMGAGMPEYLLVFRKPPSDPSNGYADTPVRKDKAEYSRPRWQFDAHGFMRSSGDRPLQPEDLDGLDQAEIFRRFREHSFGTVYDFRHDVKIAERVDAKGWLPSRFMLLQPQSWQDDVWTDVVRMRSLNTMQASKGNEQHLCPLPFDIVERCIEQYSMRGETVLDPFAGLMTVPERAVRLGREGIGIELNPDYYSDGAAYCAAAANEMSMPSLFDLIDMEESEKTEKEAS